MARISGARLAAFLGAVVPLLTGPACSSCSPTAPRADAGPSRTTNPDPAKRVVVDAGLASSSRSPTAPGAGREFWRGDAGPYRIAAPDPSKRVILDGGLHVWPNQLVVAFRAGTTRSEAEAIAATVGGRSVSHLSGELYQVEVTASTYQESWDIARRLKAHPLVVMAMPNVSIRNLIRYPDDDHSPPPP